MEGARKRRRIKMRVGVHREEGTGDRCRAPEAEIRTKKERAN